MSESQYAPSPRWELDSLFPGGCDGPAVLEAVEQLRLSLGALLEGVNALQPPDGDPGVRSAWSQTLLGLERLDDECSQLATFAHCRVSEDAENVPAKRLLAVCSELFSTRNQIEVPLRSRLAEADKAGFDALVVRPELEHMRTHLRELRERAEISMDPALEALHEELAHDGFHAWSRLYDNVAATLRVEVDMDEGTELLSTEQAKNLLDSPDFAVRERVAQGITVAWESQQEVFAAALNHINGYRQSLYRRRGIDELEVPLRESRMSRQSLEAMFEAIEGFRPTMARFLRTKAQLLGLDALRWYDLEVALGRQGARVDYAAAQDFINHHFHGFSDELGRYARMAFQRQWIEVEDRPGKRQGGYCADLPITQESRIFMTYGGNPGSVQTLAHELGHGYHNWVLRDLPAWQRNFPATLAEAASTFAESIIREAAYREAADDEVRLGILDRKLTDAVAMTMNIPARYQFERAMYAARQKGELQPEQLSELVVEAFANAHHQALGAYDKMFWASKLHFYITELPFYNFPYAVGYLFSLSLYARAVEEGPGFAAKYDATLRLTGDHSCEQVAKNALDVDISEPHFWQSALDLIAADVDELDAVSARLSSRN